MMTTMVLLVVILNVLCLWDQIRFAFKCFVALVTTKHLKAQRTTPSISLSSEKRWKSQRFQRILQLSNYANLLSKSRGSLKHYVKTLCVTQSDLVSVTSRVIAVVSVLSTDH